MSRRTARRRRGAPQRGAAVEAPCDLVSRLRALEGVYDWILVDCLTLWVSNLLLRGDRDDAILDKAEALAGLIGRRRSSFTLVSNEVGQGVHPETAMGLRFRDLQGSVNQRVAAVCTTGVLMVAGIPLTVTAPAVGA